MTMPRLIIALACTLALTSTGLLAASRDHCSEFLGAVATAKAAHTALAPYEKKPHRFSIFDKSPEAKAWRNRRVALIGAFREAIDRGYFLARNVEIRISDKMTRRLLEGIRDYQQFSSRLGSLILDWRMEKNALFTSPELDFNWSTSFTNVLFGALTKACDLGLVERGK